MICKHCDAIISDEAKFCPSCGARVEREQPAENNTEPSWYYLVNGQAQGPAPQSLIIQMIQSGQLQRADYIWNPSLPDWVRVENSSLAGSLPPAMPSFNSAPAQEDISGGYTQPNEQSAPVVVNVINDNSWSNQNGSWQDGRRSRPAIVSRNIWLNLLFCVLTCGIYTFFWLYMVAKDVNTVLSWDGKRPMINPVLNLLITLLVCSLFQLYYMPVASSRLSQCDINGYVPEDNSVVMILLVLFFYPGAVCLLQSQLNRIAQA